MLRGFHDVDDNGIDADISSTLSEAALEWSAHAAAEIYTGFFRRVGNKMQLSEGAARGETGSDSSDTDGDGIPFIPE